MASETQIQLRSVVEQIFSNWTAMQLAVEHSMGGPHSRQIVLQTVDHICNYCLTTNDIQVEDITDELEDIMDEELDTICEDNSPNEVARLIWQFLQMLKQGNVEQFQIESNNLPLCKTWLSQPQPVVAMGNVDSSKDVECNTNAESSMDVDPEWTVVKNRKKK